MGREKVGSKFKELLAEVDHTVAHIRLQTYTPRIGFKIEVFPWESDDSDSENPERLRVELLGEDGGVIKKTELGTTGRRLMDEIQMEVLRFIRSRNLTASIYNEGHRLDSWVGNRPLLHDSPLHAEAQCASLLEARGYQVHRAEDSLRVYREFLHPPRRWYLVFFPLNLVAAVLGMVFGIPFSRTLRTFLRSALTGLRTYVEVSLAGGKVTGRCGEEGHEYEYVEVEDSDILALQFSPQEGDRPFETTGLLRCLTSERRYILPHLLPGIGYSNLTARPLYEEGLALKELLVCVLTRVRASQQVGDLVRRGDSGPTP